MRDLAILNCVDDAKHFINSKYKDANCLIVSIHPSVNDYLENNNIQIQCQDLMEYIEYDRIEEIFIETEQIVNDMLLKLDARFSPALNNMLKANSLRWFYALYRYMGKLEYFGIYKMYEALKNIITQEDFNKVIVYRSIKTGYFSENDHLAEIVKLLHNNLCVFDNKEGIRDYPLEAKNRKKRGASFSFKKNCHKWLSAFRNKKARILQNSLLLNIKRRDILCFLPFSNLEFINSKLKKRILLADRNGKNIIGRISSQERAKLDELKKTINNSRLDLDLETKGLKGLLLKEIISDFCQILEYNFCVIKGLDLYNRKNKIKLGIWSISPVWKASALMVEYLLRQNISVLGTQHGNLYCEFNLAWLHFDSDFNWCHYFLSYGFSEEDLKETYPEREKLCTIMPLGNIKHLKKMPQAKKEKIDLLFPLTWSFPIMPGVMNIKNYDLANIQKQLLLFLNNYEDKRIVVKPFPFSNDKNSAVVWLMKKLNNLEVISDLYLQKVIEKYDVRACLIEYPSTPLQDAMVGCKACEIFVLDNNFSKYTRFTQKFKKEIEKSVHIFDNLEMLKDALERYFNGLCERKDLEYYARRYYQRPDTNKKALELVNKLYIQDN